MNIELENLTKKYDGKTILDNLSVIFPENKIAVVMGKSGIGKSTLLKCIAGLTTYSGAIKGAENVACVFQEDRLIPFMSVNENLDFTIDKTVGKTDRRQKISKVLQDVGLTEKSGALPDELSGGQKKRVSLARAFLSDAPVVLLDEPMNSLDFGLRIKTVELFLNMLIQSPKTVIYVTHDIDEGLKIADNIFILDEHGISYKYIFSNSSQGRDILSGECAEVKRKLIEFLV